MWPLANSWSDLLPAVAASPKADEAPGDKEGTQGVTEAKHLCYRRRQPGRGQREGEGVPGQRLRVLTALPTHPALGVCPL